LKQVVESVVELSLPVAERLIVQRTRFADHAGGPRIAVVTGTHGDELEGQLVCAWLGDAIRSGRWELRGTLDVYPALNPLGIDAISRNVPPLDIDLNRAFDLGQTGQLSFLGPLTDGILESLMGADAVVDVHASNIFLREIPQVRISKANAASLKPLVDFLWIHEAATVLENTLSYSLNSRATPTLVVEMGVGMRITPEYARDLVTGIGVLATYLGAFGPDRMSQPLKSPLDSEEGKIHHVNSPAAGLFLPAVDHSRKIRAGQRLGGILSPQTGMELAEVVSPADAIIFTLREYPVVMEGSLLARLFEPARGGVAP